MKKITLLALLLGFSFLVALTQQLNKKVTLRHQNVPVETVLRDIEKRYGVRFHYNATLIQHKKRVTLNIENQPLDKALQQVLEPNGLTYVVVHGYIVIKEKPRKSNPPVRKISQPAPEPTKEVMPTLVQQNDSTEAFTAAADSADLLPPAQPANLPEDSSLKPEQKERIRLEKRLEYLTDSILTLNTLKDTTLMRGTLLELQDAAGKVMDSLAKPSFLWLKGKLDDVEIKAPKLPEALNRNPEDTLPPPRLMPFQMTFITPMGTNGWMDHKTANIVSINILLGRSAGVRGFEVGGLGNINSGKTYGMQTAGLFNLSGKEVVGIQAAGLLNTSGRQTVGLQASGLVNYSKKEVTGLQVAGIANTTGARTNGVQAAGIVNYNNGYINGIQTAGISNITTGGLRGLQAAGIVNIMHGELLGLQAAGIGNINSGETRGLQTAGIFNLATSDMDGVQIAGIINIAKKVTGSQIGLINYSDTITGVPVGLFSYSRKGYKRLAVWGTESQMAYLGFKTGSDRFYNMIFAGIGRFSTTNMCSYGYGFGSENKLGKRLYISSDLMAQTITELPFNFQNRLDLLSTAQVALGVKLNKRVSFFAGPSFNVYVSNTYRPDKNAYGLPIGPNRVFEEVYAGRNKPVMVAMWPGIQAGFTF